MSRSLRDIAILVAALVLAACRPPPLTEPPPDLGGPDTAPPTGDTHADTTDGGDVSPPPFSAVSTILADNCAKSNCHGSPATGASDFEIGTNAPSDADVRGALEGVTIDEPMASMIAPGRPRQSGLYQAIRGLEGRTEMPPGDDLTDAQIATIRRWIAGGAPYE